MNGAQGVLLARALWGSVLVAVPDRVLGVIQPGGPSTPGAHRVLRVLGVRHLLQAGAEALVPWSLVQHLSAATDGVHALSAVGFAVLDPRWRRGALIDSVIAATFGAATALTADGRGR